MIGLAFPCDEIVVKNPGFCAPPIDGEVATLISAALGDVCTFQASTSLPPLLTTRPHPSTGSTK
jgi:hypothetical protein